MPFTFSHPAAALPIWPLIRRGVLPLAPFVVGAMTPDFEYLLRLEPLSLVSHSVRGLFVFCLPVGAVLWAFWEWLVRPVGRDLFALTPSPVSDALSSARDSSARASSPGGTRPGAWLGVVVALLLGSASHVGWDAFTHRYAWGGENVPLLRETAFTVGGTAVPWYNALQHASTLLGGMVVLGWLWGEVTRGGGALAALWAPRRLRRWLALGAVALAVGAWNAPRRGQMVNPRRLPLVAGRLVVGAMTGFAVALVALSVLHRMGRYRLTDPTGTHHA